MNYGRFSDNGLEYMVERFDTPRPWINCLTNGKYCALVSHTGGGYSFLESSGYGRITRTYPPETILKDRPGRYVYLRDCATGDYWSVNWQPVQRPPVFWRAFHGLGYTRILSETMGVSGEILYFVPLSENLEVWRVRLRNNSPFPRLLSSYCYVEWCLGNYAFDLVEAGFANLFNRVEQEDGVILATKSLWNIGHKPQKPHAPWDKVAFMGTDVPVTGFETIREDFIGMYRSLANPLAIETARLSNATAVGRDSCGVLEIPLNLEPGEQREFSIMVGAAESREQAKALVERFGQPGTITEELERLNSYWRSYTERVMTDSPDKDLDLAINVWNKYQVHFTFEWARMSSYYVGGGSIVGFRDSCQDTMGLVAIDPARVRSRLLDIASHQFKDGGTLHNWDPVTGSGPRTGHSDDPLWLVLAVAAYLRETGEMDFLDEDCEFYDEGEDTIYQHLIKSIQYTLGRLSPRGIPLMGAADWNDGLDQVGSLGRGESIMTAGLLGFALREMVSLAERLEDDMRKREYLGVWEKLSKAINEHLWDGKWYQRATTDDGHVIGSSKNDEGRIYLNAQTWPILSGLAPRDRAVEAMDAVKEMLDTPYGPALFLPAYTNPDSRIGIITMFSPGTKENGTIFSHPVAWAIMAESMLGRGNLAHEYYRKASFMSLSKDPDRYRAEPYVYAEFIHGKDSPYYGMGEFTWTTGTAPWMFKVCVEWILGVRPEFDGLQVDPCIPSVWPGLRVRRQFRGATYDIRVENPEGVQWGVTRVLVDGEENHRQILPDFQDGKVHEILVQMGKKGEFTGDSPS